MTKEMLGMVVMQKRRDLDHWWFGENEKCSEPSFFFFRLKVEISYC